MLIIDEIMVTNLKFSKYRYLESTGGLFNLMSSEKASNWSGSILNLGQLCSDYDWLLKQSPTDTISEYFHVDCGIINVFNSETGNLLILSNSKYLGFFELFSIEGELDLVLDVHMKIDLNNNKFFNMNFDSGMVVFDSSTKLNEELVLKPVDREIRSHNALIFPDAFSTTKFYSSYVEHEHEDENMSMSGIVLVSPS